MNINLSIPSDMVETTANALRSHANWFRRDSGHATDGIRVLHADADRMDELADAIESELASPTSDEQLPRGCPVHHGTVHGGEAEELRAGIEAIIDTLDRCEDVTGARSWLNALLDRVDARDSLAHLERDDLKGDLDRINSELDAVYRRAAQLTVERDRALEVMEASRDAVDDHETTASISTWQVATFGPGTRLSYLARAEQEMRELRELLEANEADPSACAEVADVVILLSHIVASHDRELSDEVDAKMSINRARRWRMTSAGHGQHIEEP